VPSGELANSVASPNDVASAGGGADVRVRHSGIIESEISIEASWNGTAGKSPLAPSSSCPIACPQ
jgi:hypothetical protein